MKRHTLLALVCLSLATATATGCAATTDDEAAGATDEALSAREGYKKLPPLGSDVYVSVAVSGKTAFLGDNFRTLRAYDLTTQRVTRTLRERVPTDSLSVSGNTLIACGETEVDVPGGTSIFGETALHYQVTVFDARTLTKKQTLLFDIESVLDETQDQIRDKPNMACKLDGSTVSIGFAQEKLKDELVSFPLPAGDVKTDFRTIPGATRVTISPVADRNNTVIGFTQSAAGITFAAGGYGIRRLAPGARSYASLRDVEREHIVDLAARGGTLFAANHSGSLLVLDEATGREKANIAIPDWIEGVALADGYVVVIGREGILVQKDTWSR
jgi:hypothetical protein